SPSRAQAPGIRSYSTPKQIVHGTANRSGGGRLQPGGTCTRPQLRVLRLEGLLGVEDAGLVGLGGGRFGGKSLLEERRAALEEAGGDGADAGVDGDVGEGAGVLAAADEDALGEAGGGGAACADGHDGREPRAGHGEADRSGDGAARGGGADAPPVLDLALGDVLADRKSG